MSVVERAINKLRQTADPLAARPTTAATGALGALASAPNDFDSAPGIANANAPRIGIDREALRKLGYLPETEQDRRFADEYRQIKRQILAAAFAPKASDSSPNPRLIMMTSALPGDGKTFTSINLALSLAREQDTTVVLVDADVSKPNISRMFGVDREPGLLDLLVDRQRSVESVLLAADLPGLTIMPAGSPRDGATELLASARMAEVAAKLAARNSRSVVVFDTSPMLVTTEPHAIRTYMGQIVLVVRAGQTPRQAVLDVMATLGEDKRVGLVLNQGTRGPSSGYYGYGYGDESKSQ